MAKKSIGQLHATVTANADGFVNEFKRADNASRRSSAAINTEVDKLTKSVKKKFELADFGKDVMKGAGLFGGFQIAQTAAEAIVGYWERAAAAAKSIEETTKSQLDTTLKIIALNQTEAQQEEALIKRRDEAKRAMDAAASKTTYQVMGRGKATTFKRDLSKDEAEDLKQKTIEYDALRLAVEQLEKKKRDLTAADLESTRASDQARRIASLAEGLKIQEADTQSLIETQKKANEETAKTNEEAARLADKYRDLADPMREYKKTLAEIAALESAGKLLYDEAWAAKVEIWAKMAEAANKANPGTDFAALKEVSPDQVKAADDAILGIQLNALETERIVGRAADGMADAWVDSLRGVSGAWSNLADSIINEILRVSAQLLVVKPLINSLGGVFSGFGMGTLGAAFTGYGGGKAIGGGIEAGVTYRVNEQGEEFFKSNTGGTIIPAGISARMSGRDSVKANYYIDATGADAGKIAQLEGLIRSLHGSIENRAVSAVISARRRGGSMAAALG
jgi:hypothetical protein